MCKKGTKIDTAKLMTDILCWPYYNTRNEITDFLLYCRRTLIIYFMQAIFKRVSFFAFLLHIYTAHINDKIGYLIDEDEKAILIRYIKRYIKMCKKGTKIDTEKLMTDILCWPYYNTRNEWIDVIAGIKKIDKKKEKK